SLKGSSHSISVVFTNKDYRKFPQHSHIHGFIKCTLSYSSVSKIANVYIFRTLVFLGESNTSAYRDLSTNYPVTSHKFMFFREEVHRASFSTRTSCSFSKKLGHTSVSRYAFCQSMSVVTICCNQGVFWTNYRHSPCYYSLLANVQVTKSSNFLLTV